MEFAEHFWMVHVESANEPVKRHPTLEIANAEAERLAKMPGLQGRKVFVLEVVGCCVYRPTIWIPIDQSKAQTDAIPF